MSRKLLRAISLALALILGVAVVPLALAAGDSKPARTATKAKAKAASKRAKPRVRTFTSVRSGAPRLLPNVKRSCGRSKSSKKLRSRTRKQLRADTIRYTYRYCSGRRVLREITTRTIRETKTVVTTKVIAIPGPVTTTPGPIQVVTVPGPATPGPIQVVTVPGPATPAPTPAARSFKLTLLHNNDGESKYATGDSIPNYGGVARFKTVVDRLRADADAAPTDADQDKGTLVVSSGDNFLAGSGFTAGLRRNQQTGAPLYDSVAMNGIGYDAATLGNHEYDFGPDVLGTFIEGTDGTFPFLTANVDTAGEPALEALRDRGRIADAAIITEGGQRVGVIGVSPPNLKGISTPGNVVVSQFIAGVVNNVARQLKDSGVNKVILSSHLQDLNNEQALVPMLHGVDVVIGGGGDNLLADADDTLIPGKGDPANPAPKPEGGYPLSIEDADGVTVPVVTTSGEYDYVGRLTATFDAGGRLTSVDGAKSGPVRVSGRPGDADIAAEDPGLKASVVDPINAFKAGLKANVIGTSDAVLDGGGEGQPVRNRETNLGDVVADGFRYAANRTAVADGRPVAKVAFSNGGGVRVTVPAGDISEQTTFDVLPFSNFISTVPSVSFAKLKELMEWGVASAPTNNGKFPQISGFKMTIDTARKAAVVTGDGPEARTTVPGERVQTLTLDDGTPVVVGGVVQSGGPIALATTDFTAANGDNYPFNVPFVRSSTAYTQSLFDFISNTDTVDGLTALGGSITTARYPGTDRILQRPLG